MSPKVLGMLAGILAVTGGVIIISLSALDSVQRHDGIGMVINTPTRATSVQQVDQTFSDASSLGIGRSNVYMFWNIIEPRRGSFDWSQPDILMGLNEKNDLKVTLYFSVINGPTLGPFPDWIGSPSVGSIGQDRLVGVLDEILSRYHIIDYVIISGETESQFRYAPENIPIYKELFLGTYEQLKQMHPDVKFGNSFALHHILNKELGHIASDLAVGDFVAFSYLPVDSLNDIVKTPRQAGDDLSKAFDLVPGKKIAFFEVGWSTSGFVGGDHASQQDFIREAFEFYRQHDSEIEFINWYRQHDRPPGTCAVQLADVGGKSIPLEGSGLGGNDRVIERLDHYTCNAGLVDVNGDPKTGWAEFERQIGMLN